MRESAGAAPEQAGQGSPNASPAQGPSTARGLPFSAKFVPFPGAPRKYIHAAECQVAPVGDPLVLAGQLEGAGKGVRPAFRPTQEGGLLAVVGRRRGER